MELLEAIARRRSYRGRFRSQPVPREDLAKIMDAGLAAPSGCNKQTVSLIAVDDPAVLARIRAVIDPPVGETAPAAICVLTRRVNAYRDRCFAVQDYAAAIENMLLAITALGYQSCWYEGHITDDDRICDRIAEILRVPAEYDLVCFLPIGVGESEAKMPKKRPFGERAFFNAFPSREVSFRSYRPEDYEAVCTFLEELNRGDTMHINWNWARWEWMYLHDEMDSSQLDKIGLWWADGAVVCAAVYDMYPGEGACLWLPAYRELAPEILTYAAEKLADDRGFALAVNVRDLHTKKLLASLGFSREEQTEYLMACDLNHLPHAPLPKGYTFRELDMEKDGDAAQWLMWRGFDHGSDLAECQSETKPVQPRPHGRKELALAVVNPEGEDVSFCSCWYLERTDYAYVEPVCTIPEYRGKGLARSALTEALTRCYALGAGKAYVISDLDFYRRLGFRDVERYTFWRK